MLSNATSRPPSPRRWSRVAGPPAGDPGTAGLDAGLFFLSYQRDPRVQFIPIQGRLARDDALNEYIVHDGSAIFAVPPGAGPDGWIGDTLFA